MAYDNLKLEKGLYTTGKSFTQALEQIDGLQAASAGYGPGWREPQAAAQVQWVRAERQSQGER